MVGAVGVGKSNNYAYLVKDDPTNDAVIIDPANPDELSVMGAAAGSRLIENIQSHSRPRASGVWWQHQSNINCQHPSVGLVAGNSSHEVLIASSSHWDHSGGNDGIVSLLFPTGVPCSQIW